MNTSNAELAQLDDILDQMLGKVVAHFLVTFEPGTGVPRSHGEDWVGLRLPIRRRPLMQGHGTRFLDTVLRGQTNEIECIVPVYGHDAMGVLEMHNRARAVEHWKVVGLPYTSINFKPADGILGAIEEVVLDA